MEELLRETLVEISESLKYKRGLWRYFWRNARRNISKNNPLRSVWRNLKSKAFINPWRHSWKSSWRNVWRNSCWNTWRNSLGSFWWSLNSFKKNSWRSSLIRLLVNFLNVDVYANLVWNILRNTSNSFCKVFLTNFTKNYCRNFYNN